MEENNGKKGRYQRKEIAKTPLKGNKSAIDIATEVDFMKIREGESFEQWESRTQKLRVLPESEHEKREYVYKTRKDAKPITARVAFEREKKEEQEYMKGMTKQQQYAYRAFLKKARLKGLVVYKGNRDPLLHYKYMFVIMRMFEVRHGLKQTELLFLLHLYTIDRPFLKREFDEKALVSKGVSFNKYLKNGIILRLKYKENENNYKKTGYSPYYTLTKKAYFMMRSFFKYSTGQIQVMNEQKWYYAADDKEEMKVMVDMYHDLRQQIKDLEQGTISDDKFYPIGLNMDALVNPLGDGNIIL